MAIFNNALAGAAGQAGGAAPAGYAIERSLRFNRSDSAYLNRTPSAAGNRKTWTWSGWVKFSDISAQQTIFSAAADVSNRVWLRLNSSSLEFQLEEADVQTNLYTNAVYRDPSAWYHIVIAVDTTQSTSSNRSKLYVNGEQVTSFSAEQYPAQNYDTYVNAANIHRIGSASWSLAVFADSYMADVHFIDGQALAASDFGEFDDNGVWQPIEYTGTYGTNGFHLDFSDNSSAAALGTDSSGNNNDWTVNNLESGVPGNVDASGYTVSSGPGTGPNDANLVFDGDTTTRTFAHGYGTHYVHIDTSSSPIAVNNTDTLTIWWKTSVTNPRDATLELVINGTSRTYTTFTNTGQGSVQSNTVTVGYTGDIEAIKLNEASASNPGELHINAIQLNGTYLVTTQEPDSLFDSPTNGAQTDTGLGGEVSGNYATLNPLTLSGNGTISDGNLRFVANSAAYTDVKSTIGATTGKWYAELNVVTRCDSTHNQEFGIFDGIGNPRLYATFNNFTYTMVNGASNTSTGVTSNSGDVMQVAYDADTGKVWLGANGTWFGSGNPSTGANPYVTITANTQFFFYTRHYGTSGVSAYNFGQRAFTHTAPSGFKALNTANLDDPTIADGSTAMDAKLYTGNGSTQTISGLGFSPDFVWIKCRSAAESGRITDIVRGAPKYLNPSSTAAENAGGSAALTSFNSDGFSVGSGSAFNGLNETYVGWAWDAGTSTVSNTDGSITSSVRANASAGFSIVSWVGTNAAATVGHGLNDAPQMIIIKNRDDSVDWRVYHGSLGDDEGLRLNTTGAKVTGRNDWWNNTSPTGTVFSVANDNGVNGSGDDIIAYCFAPVEGYSAFGSYEGNGNASGPMVYTGHAARLVIIKNADGTGNWRLYDTARDNDGNENTEILYANSSIAESTTAHPLDFLSNGFKVRGTHVDINTSGQTYIYMSFAENPFKTARAR